MFFMLLLRKLEFDFFFHDRHYYYILVKVLAAIQNLPTCSQFEFQNQYHHLFLKRINTVVYSMIAIISLAILIFHLKP